MRRIILFSATTESNIHTVLEMVFPATIKNKILAYMPCDGANCPQRYVEEWEKYAKENSAEFRYIDNSKAGLSEAARLLTSNILLITGGNTFTLLNNLRKSQLDKAITEFSKKNEFVIAGFSAGAIVLTPTINVCTIPGYDENLVGLENLSALSLVNFEIFPHYSETYKITLDDYRVKTPFEVNEISEDSYLIVDM